ncbi:MAG: hypothetical protein IKY62_01120, partial [Clostridia bacterium]|nr:hypothetical protein [Clostridia bacterium]
STSHEVLFRSVVTCGLRAPSASEGAAEWEFAYAIGVYCVMRSNQFAIEYAERALQISPA